MQNANGNPYRTGDHTLQEYQRESVNAVGGQGSSQGGSLMSLFAIGIVVVSVLLVLGNSANRKSKPTENHSNSAATGDAFIEELVRELESNR